jgi:hypothetical protein
MKQLWALFCLFLLLTHTTANTPYPPPYNIGIFSPPPSNDQICPSVVDQILGVSSLYQIDNVCDLLLSTSDTLKNYTQGFKANCSAYDDVLTIEICNRLNNDDVALNTLIEATLDAVEVMAQQCVGCSITNGETNSATREIAQKLPSGESKSKMRSHSRNLLQPQSNCERVGQCFSTCNDCQRYDVLCGAVSTAIKNLACGVLGLAVNAVVRVVANGLCVGAAAALCQELAVPCAGACLTFVGGVAGIIAGGGGCIIPNIVICNNIDSACNTCRSQTGQCDPSNSACCAGETGTECGVDCCCCPECYAPGGPYCECLPASCPYDY